jgi:hypothetical protein
MGGDGVRGGGIVIDRRTTRRVDRDRDDEQDRSRMWRDRGPTGERRDPPSRRGGGGLAAFSTSFFDVGTRVDDGRIRGRGRFECT